MNVENFKIILPHKVLRFVRTDSGRFFDITEGKPLTDGHIDQCNGVFPSAKEVLPEFVAELVADAEQRQERSARAEAALRGWIEFRNAWSRKPSKKGKLKLIKKEVGK